MTGRVRVGLVKETQSSRLVNALTAPFGARGWGRAALRKWYSDGKCSVEGTLQHNTCMQALTLNRKEVPWVVVAALTSLVAHCRQPLILDT
ncbi:hypothetical protein E2C01_007916 [Portunus trituberculatus]|uniref:Uncharacterized protein n=1 Tax=Portunus trituberculatus TaxID=210409 RepID=A0A5B7D4Z5_PORTR|nr:hypothetical protein [Portunus trituberculatus]